MGSDIALEIMHVVGIGADPVARAGHVSFGHRIGVGSRTCTSGNPRATRVITSLTPRALAMEGERHRTVTVASAEHTLRRINEFVPPAIDENRGLQNDDGAQPARKPPAKTSAVLALTSNVLARGGIQSIRDRNRTGAAEAGSPTTRRSSLWTSGCALRRSIWRGSSESHTCAFESHTSVWALGNFSDRPGVPQ